MLAHIHPSFVSFGQFLDTMCFTQGLSRLASKSHLMLYMNHRLGPALPPYRPWCRWLPFDHIFLFYFRVLSLHLVENILYMVRFPHVSKNDQPFVHNGQRCHTVVIVLNPYAIIGKKHRNNMKLKEGCISGEEIFNVNRSKPVSPISLLPPTANTHRHICPPIPSIV